MTNMYFEAGTVVLESRPSVTIEDMKASAFNTRFRTPRTIPVTLYETGFV